VGAIPRKQGSGGRSHGNATRRTLKRGWGDHTMGWERRKRTRTSIRLLTHPIKHFLCGVEVGGATGNRDFGVILLDLGNSVD